MRAGSSEATMLVFLHHVHRYIHRNVPMQPHGDFEVAQRLDRFVQLDLLAVDGVALLFERRRDIGGASPNRTADRFRRPSARW